MEALSYVIGAGMAIAVSDWLPRRQRHHFKTMTVLRRSNILTCTPPRAGGRAGTYWQSETSVSHGHQETGVNCVWADKVPESKCVCVEIKSTHTHTHTLAPQETGLSITQLSALKLSASGFTGESNGFGV